MPDVAQPEDTAGRRSTPTALSGESGRATARWRAALPDQDLTWGVRVSGEAFVTKMRSYVTLHPATSIVEIGPGYGRLLSEILETGLPFGSYLGIDLSESNCRMLEEKFGSARIKFLHADAAGVRLPRPFDVLISSLTFKHMYPTFEKALSNLGSQGVRGGRLVFDLMEAEPWNSARAFAVRGVRNWLVEPSSVRSAEGSDSGANARGVLEPVGVLLDFLRSSSYGFFASDGVTYIRKYSRSSVLRILEHTGLRLVAFDQVWHDAGHRRLLVVAEVC